MTTGRERSAVRLRSRAHGLTSSRASFLLALIFLSSVLAHSAELKPQTLAAFDNYARTAEARIDREARQPNFLWAAESPARLAQVRNGDIVTAPKAGKGDLPVPDGLVHDWIGAAFLTGATIDRVLAFVQDYNRHKDTHQPEVLDSKLLARNGNDFKIYLRLRKKKVITVVLNTEHAVHYTEIAPTRWVSASRATRIAEVDSPGTPKERELPVGSDHGYLWRLNSYWRFAERDGGVYVECEAISLTRNVPTGLGWIIEPIIRSLPAESLASTLRSTRDSVRSRMREVAEAAN